MQGTPSKENLTRENAWLEVRASLKIAVTLQRRHFALTFMQVFDITKLSCFFFPHQGGFFLSLANGRLAPQLAPDTLVSTNIGWYERLPAMAVMPIKWALLVLGHPGWDGAVRISRPVP